MKHPKCTDEDCLDGNLYGVSMGDVNLGVWECPQCEELKAETKLKEDHEN